MRWTRKGIGESWRECSQKLGFQSTGQSLGIFASETNGCSAESSQTRVLGLAKVTWKDGGTVLELMNSFTEYSARDLGSKIRGNLSLLVPVVQAWVSNRQSKVRAHDVARVHYNLDNDLFVRSLIHIISIVADTSTAKTTWQMPNCARCI